MTGHEDGEPPSVPEGAGDSPVEDTTSADAQPTMPERFRQSLVYTVADAMGGEFQHEVGTWLHHNRDRLKRARVGTHGVDLTRRAAWLIEDVDACHAPFASALRGRVLEELGAACKHFDVEPFDVEPFPMQATMYHHHGFYAWHRDRYEDTVTAQRRMAWLYYLHAEPRRFMGGELEFLDGRLVDPQTDTLVIFPAEQLHRVRAVECYTAGVEDARWTINGWLETAP